MEKPAFSKHVCVGVWLLGSYVEGWKGNTGPERGGLTAENRLISWVPATLGLAVGRAALHKRGEVLPSLLIR